MTSTTMFNLYIKSYLLMTSPRCLQANKGIIPFAEGLAPVSGQVSTQGFTMTLGQPMYVNPAGMMQQPPPTSTTHVLQALTMAAQEGMQPPNAAQQQQGFMAAPAANQNPQITYSYQVREK